MNKYLKAVDDPDYSYALDRNTYYAAKAMTPVTKYRACPICAEKTGTTQRECAEHIEAAHPFETSLHMAQGWLQIAEGRISRVVEDRARQEERKAALASYAEALGMLPDGAAKRAVAAAEAMTREAYARTARRDLDNEQGDYENDMRAAQERIAWLETQRPVAASATPKA